MESVKAKPAHKRPLMSGQIYDIGRKIKALHAKNLKPEYGLWESEAWKNFVSKYLEPALKEQDFLLGGHDPKQKTNRFFDHFTDNSKNKNETESDQDSEDSNAWNYDNGINFNDYFNDDVADEANDDSDKNTLRNDIFEIEFGDKADPQDVKEKFYSSHIYMTTLEKNVDDLLGELGI